jgi:hypothetical protein
MASTIRPHRAEVFARRERGETITTADLLAADAADDAADPDGAMHRLRSRASSLSERSGIPHHVWRVPGAGLRPASLCVLPSAYASADWVRVQS